MNDVTANIMNQPKGDKVRFVGPDLKRSFFSNLIAPSFYCSLLLLIAQRPMTKLFCRTCVPFHHVPVLAIIFENSIRSGFEFERIIAPECFKIPRNVWGKAPHPV